MSRSVSPRGGGRGRTAALVSAGLLAGGLAGWLWALLQTPSTSASRQPDPGTDTGTEPWAGPTPTSSGEAPAAVLHAVVPDDVVPGAVMPGAVMPDAVEAEVAEPPLAAPGGSAPTEPAPGDAPPDSPTAIVEGVAPLPVEAAGGAADLIRTAASAARQRLDANSRAVRPAAPEPRPAADAGDDEGDG